METGRGADSEDSPGQAPSIEIVQRGVAECRACAADFGRTRDRHRPRPVLRISARARICVCGQAPGRRVHMSGLPFDDPSGDRLRLWMGVGRERFYDAGSFAFLPMAFCYPGRNERGSDLPPPARCARLWRRQLLAVLPGIEFTVVVGGYACRWHLGPAAGLTDSVKRWRELLPERMVLPHPSWRNNAWLQRNPWFEEETLPALRGRIRELLDRDASPRNPIAPR